MEKGMNKVIRNVIRNIGWLYTRYLEFEDGTYDVSGVTGFVT